MPQYTYQQTLDYLLETLHIRPIQKDIETGQLELLIDGLHVLLSKGKAEGSMRFRLRLGLLVQPIREQALYELASSNFLGVNTGGCKLCFDESGVALSLISDTTPGTHPKECWDWLHRTLCVAREWFTILEQWEEFVPLNDSRPKNGGNHT